MFAQTPYAKRFLNKVAFVPYTQEAMNPPQPAPGPEAGGAMPPEMAGGMPPEAAGMPPQGGAMPPEAAGAGMPPQGGAPQIQIVQGPNGEPIDAQTGFIVLDPQQGIEQDPLTGILVNLTAQQFATPEGQPLDPEQAIQMIMQAREQAGAAQGAPGGGAMPPEAGAAPGPGAMPPEAGGMPPEAGMPPADAAAAAGGMPPEAAGAGAPPPEAAAPEGAPMPPPNPNQSFDPSTGMMMDDATGMPVDPNTGMIVDPSTGQQIDPQSGMPAPQQPAQDMPFTDDPEVLKVVDSVSKETERLSKSVSGLTRNVNATRTDLQGIRREISELNDKHDAVLERVDDLLGVAEKLFRGGVNAPTVGEISR